MKKLILSMFLLSFSIILNARTVYVHVQDATDNEPMSGVWILVKGTNYGAMTGPDGNAALLVPDDATMLVVSFVGYVTREVPIMDEILVRLSPDDEILEQMRNYVFCPERNLFRRRLGMDS